MILIFIGEVMVFSFNFFIIGYVVIQFFVEQNQFLGVSLGNFKCFLGWVYYI